MAKKNIKITKEELQEDEVLEFTDHAIFWLKTHANKILTVATIIFAIYAGVVLLHQRTESKLAKASDLFYSAVQNYNQAIAKSAWATKDRTDAMKRVVAQCDDIIARYGDTELARNALFLKGNAYYFAGDDLGSTANTQEAIKEFGLYRDRAQKEGDGFEQAAALIALGYAHENMFLLTMSGNEEQARQSLTAAGNYYDDVTKIKDAGFLRFEAMNAKARLLDYLGKKDEAKALYEQVAKEHYTPVKPPENDASRRDQLMYSLKSLANQFTAGRTAIVQLKRMGEDVDKYENPDKADSAS